ncbi:DUF1800 domain-containing protein [Piscinibacter terrae]|nr:DUF1800 domain-containing protein [Albitalea terrae]
MDTTQIEPAAPQAADAMARTASTPRTLTTLAALSSSVLAACGGGSSASPPPPPPPPPPAVITRADASRFLAQASMGATADQISRVQAVGYAAWIDEQMAMAADTSRWDWLVAKGYNDIANKNSEAGFDSCAWRKLLTSPDTLRQRVTFALSEIVVAAIDGLVGGGWKAFSAAAYLDLLETHAFGNYRTLLQAISMSAPMGEYLTFRGNQKYNATTGANPDENYAREVMQLFSIGLLKLNADGTPITVGGKVQETYTQDDISGLARVFTGWNYDLAGGDTSTPDFKKRPMAMTASKHELGEKTFLGQTIPANTDGATSLTLALDVIFANANVAPFIGKQLIQRLVCSNPSTAYVSRVSAVFNNDGTGVKGNLAAVIKAILLDDEARNADHAGNANFAKLREPILRMTAWARAFGVNSASDAWVVGNTTDSSTRLGQSPLRSPSVFNFFRPGYVPPNTSIASASLVAPEFQITNESSVVGYLNFMQKLIGTGVGGTSDVKADYSAMLPLADNGQSLLDELNVLLAAGRVADASIATMKTALDTMPSGTDATRLNRIYAAILLVMATPEFIVQK